MISVVMTGHGFEGDSLRTWFDPAVKAQLDTRKPYWQISWALVPRWGGSHEEMLAFARGCRAAERYDTHLSIPFLEILRHISEDNGDWKPVFRRPEVAKEGRTFYGFDEARFRGRFAVIRSRGAADYVRAAEAYNGGRFDKAEQLYESTAKSIEGTIPLVIKYRLAANRVVIRDLRATEAGNVSLSSAQGEQEIERLEEMPAHIPSPIRVADKGRFAAIRN